VKIYIGCKHSDMFNMTVVDDEGNELLEHNGYGVGLFGVFNEGDDYINLTIDNDTGKIIGWKPMTKEEIENYEPER
jgi:hypothetical protein